MLASTISSGVILVSVAVVQRPGVEPLVFRSGHGGSLGGDYGQTRAPAAIAAKLRADLGVRD